MAQSWPQEGGEGIADKKVQTTLKRVDTIAFLNLYLALTLLGALPNTICECQRSYHFHHLGVSNHGIKTEAQ